MKNSRLEETKLAKYEITEHGSARRFLRLKIE
jgi:hypothetical protein